VEGLDELRGIVGETTDEKIAPAQAGSPLRPTRPAGSLAHRHEPMTLRTSAKLHVEEPEVLVIRCSDHRFQAGLEDFLNEHLKLDFNYDLLSIPGGPQCLVLDSYLPKLGWAGWRWSRFLLEKHAPKRMVLIAHQDCGWYKHLPEFISRTADMPKRQEEDLRKARDHLLREFPHLQVDLYFAGWDEGGHVTVAAVTP
jgi:hypothetical protein